MWNESIIGMTITKRKERERDSTKRIKNIILRVYCVIKKKAIYIQIEIRLTTMSRRYTKSTRCPIMAWIWI
jgi:hypothetical protein